MESPSWCRPLRGPPAPGRPGIARGPGVARGPSVAAGVRASLRRPQERFGRRARLLLLARVDERQELSGAGLGSEAGREHETAAARFVSVDDHEDRLVGHRRIYIGYPARPSALVVAGEARL